VLFERLQVFGLHGRARAHRLAVECVAGRAVVRIGEPVSIAVPMTEAQRGHDVGFLDHLAAFGELHQLLDRARRARHRDVVAGDGDRAVTQGDANRDRPFDLTEIGVVVPQQGEWIEMLDGELADVQWRTLAAG
jgi:hypothetical protein